MTNWLPQIEGRKGPIYQRIADAISDGIHSGTLPPGARLPPQRDLAWKLKVTVGTVSRAYMLGEQRGLLSGEVGRGTYVKPPAADGPTLYVPPGDGVLDLSINMAVSPQHGAMLARELKAIAEQRGVETLLHYMTAPLQRPHKEAAAKWLGALGLDAAPERIVLTNGAHQGLAVAFAALLKPGAPALTERMTYPGIIDNARIFGHPLIGVAMDGEGMVPEALDHAAAESGARVVFVQPTFHNPTVATMGERRRRDIVAVAQKRDLLIVEDDVYGLLPAERPPAIAALAPSRTIYINSASKAVAPGLRIGWILAPVAPAALTQALGETRYSLSGALPSLTFEVARRWFANGTARDLMLRTRAETAQRQRLAAEKLAGLAVDGHPDAFHIILTLPDPWRRENFVAAALARGVRVAPISDFIVGQTAAPHAVRVSLAAAPDRTTLAHALDTLRDLALAEKSGTRREVV